MLDRFSKRVITFLQDQADGMFLYSGDLPGYLMPESKFFAAIRYLHKKELIEIIKNQNGTHIGARLSHEALHYKEFLLANFLRYILDNWIEFVALIASITAIVISCS